jgi:hypothetical protein
MGRSLQQVLVELYWCAWYPAWFRLNHTVVDCAASAGLPHREEAIDRMLQVAAVLYHLEQEWAPLAGGPPWEDVLDDTLRRRLHKHAMAYVAWAQRRSQVDSERWEHVLDIRIRALLKAVKMFSPPPFCLLE